MREFAMGRRGAKGGRGSGAPGKVEALRKKGTRSRRERTEVLVLRSKPKLRANHEVEGLSVNRERRERVVRAKEVWAERGRHAEPQRCRRGR